MKQIEITMIREIEIAREDLTLAALKFEAAQNQYYKYITSKE